MVRQSRLGVWIGVAMAVALAATCLVLAFAGTDQKSIRLALEVTARWSFLLFWLAYAGNAVAQLTGWTGIGGHAREAGLSFAAAHLVHIGLVVWLSVMLGRIALSGGLLAVLSGRPVLYLSAGGAVFRRRQGDGTAGLAHRPLCRHELYPDHFWARFPAAGDLSQAGAAHPGAFSCLCALCRAVCRRAAVGAGHQLAATLRH